MASDSDDQPSSALSPDERRWLERVRAAGSLSQLQTITGADSDHEAYVQAKPTWEQLRSRELGDPAPTDGLPGDRVVVDGQPFHVHGVTHADTDAERTFLRTHVQELLAEDEAVHCEQGIRPMYFEEFERVVEIDDYRWAMHHCRQLDFSSHIDGLIEATFDEESGVTGNIKSAASRFREVAYSLIDSGADVYGTTFASALGDAASTFLMDHEHLATGEDFTSHELSKAAAEDPGKLPALQQYYKQAFLPQPLEREWLRRHDHELELFTHARNERIAAWALYHADNSRPIHLIVGAAHQPGVVYYLEAYREGRWDYGEFEFIP